MMLMRLRAGIKPIRHAWAANTQRSWFSTTEIDINLHQDLTDALKNRMQIDHLTETQKETIHVIGEGKDVILGAETGSGKTLAYTLPMMNRLKLFEEQKKTLHSPLGIVLVPSHILALQLFHVIENLDMNIAENVTMLSARGHCYPRKVPHLVIATPKRLLQEAMPRNFVSTETIVVDEADMLLNGDFEKGVKHILGSIQGVTRRHCEAKGVPVRHQQLVLCAATIPENGRKSFKQWLGYRLPQATRITSKGFHNNVPTLQQEFESLEDFMSENSMECGIDISSDEKRRLARNQLLLQILERNKDITKDNSTIIFANTTDSAQQLHEFLKSEGIQCSALHKKIRIDERAEVVSGLQNGTINMLIATDVAARGLDIPAIKHVIQYEFARDGMLYLHRNGRTARAGSSGKVTSIISKDNSLLVEHIRSTSIDSLSHSFSRRRSLRKKYKKKLKDPRD